MEYEVDDSPTIRFVNLVLARAVERKAEELHLERQNEAVLVEFRAGGVSIDTEGAADVPWSELVNRLKLIAGMTDYGPSPSKDGRIRYRVTGGKVFEFNVTTTPTPATDDSVVVKCLDATDSKKTL
jgi:type IV pilus assembly protein PilB